MAKTIYYTLIGSRETPPEIMAVMTKFAEKACKFGYVGRSGAADSPVHTIPLFDGEGN